MLDIFRTPADVAEAPGAEGLLRRRDHRRRLARPRRRLLPRPPPRRQERRGPREELHRLGRGRPQHDDPALELQDARGRALLRRAREALRGALQGAQLQPALLAERPPDAGPLGPRDVRHGEPRGGEPAARDRLAPDLPGRDREARAGDAGAQPGRGLADPGRALPPAGRRDPPRRGGVGASRAGPTGRRRDPSVHRGDRDQPLEREGHRRADEPRRRSARPSSSTAPPAGARSSPTWPACRCRSRRTSCRRS